jgi:hypothetical protein
MRLGGIVLLTTLTLAACSSEPVPMEPTSSTPTTSATPTRTVPTPSDQTTEDSPEGAAAFVKHYVDVFNYAAATGDVEELTRLSDPSCEGCQSYIKLYRDTYAAGGYFRGGEWRVGGLNLKQYPSETFATTEVETSTTIYRGTRDDKETAGPADITEITFGITGSGSYRRISQLALGDAK